MHVIHYFYADKKDAKEKTEVVDGKEGTTDAVMQLISAARRRIDICGDDTSPSAVMGLEAFRQALVDAKGRGVRIKYIVEITNDNISHCKELMKIISELRHLNGAKGNFAVSDSEYIGSGGALLRQQGPLHQIVFSNVKTIVKQHQYLFETLWNNACSAQSRIRGIEEGIEPVKIDVIQDPLFSREVFKQLVISADKEIMLIIPTVHAFVRDEKLGIMQLLIGATKRGVRIRVISVKHKSIEGSIENVLEQQRDGLVDVRFIKKDEGSINKATSLLVDKKSLMVIEIKDDSKDEFAEAVGLSTYSNSDPGILAYISMFEDLWTQSQLFDQVVEANKRLASANEQLKIHGKMQQEFINIAAHELRTPIQPILGAIEIMMMKQSAAVAQHQGSGGRGDLMQAQGATSEEMEIIFRNVKRLERLSQDILDVTRIESGTFKLNKEIFDLNENVRHVAADMQALLPAEKKGRLEMRSEAYGEPLTVSADKQSVFEVVSNLVNNAIKFTEQGSVTVRAGIKDGAASITVKDTGSGIDPEIKPRLFVKFASKSEQGTGLGLYISKKIIEAHGGRIWGENNADGKGASFTFTLPLHTG